MSKKKISLADLDATKHGEKPFEFEYVDPDGNQTGIFFSVLGSETEVVTKAIADQVNARRQKQANRDAARRNRNKSNADFEPIENEIEFGQRLAAIRLVGWRGIEEEFTPENALKLCQSNKDIAAQVTEQSDNSGNFLKL